MVKYKATAVHFYNTMSLMNKLRQEQSFCDVTLTVGMDHLQAHKCVLAAGSPYFQTLFLGRFTEASKNDIDLSEVTDDSTAMELIIDFIYTGEIDINNKNLKVLVKLSSFFLVETLQRFCIEFMQKTLNLKTCLRYYLYASDHGLAETLEMTEAMVKTRFHDCIIFNEESVAVSPDEMSYLISMDIFKFCNCGHFLQYILKWVLKGFSNKHLLIGCDLLDTVLQRQPQQVQSLTSVQACVEMLRSKLEDVNIEGKDDFLNKCGQVIEHCCKAIREPTLTETIDPTNASSDEASDSTGKETRHPLTDKTSETAASSKDTTTCMENIVITLSPRAAIYEQTHSVAQYDFFDFRNLQDKPLFDLCAYIPKMRQWFYIRSFDLDDNPNQLFEPWTDWGFDMLGHELVIMKQSGDDDLNLYSLEEDQWRKLNYSDQLDFMLPSNEFGNDLCFVTDSDGKMYLISRVRVFSDDNNEDPLEVYFKGYQFDQLSNSWVSIFDSEKIDVTEICVSGFMDMRAKVSSKSGEMLVVYSTDAHCVALIIDLKQAVKQPINLISDFSEDQIFNSIRIIETTDRYLLVSDGNTVSKGMVSVQYEYIFHSHELLKMTDVSAVSIGEFKLTPDLRQREIFPCLTHVSVDQGEALWYLEGDMGHVSSLSQVSFDEDRYSTVIQHIPPPFTSITAMFIGKINTHLLSRLKPVYKCF